MRISVSWRNRDSETFNFYNSSFTNHPSLGIVPAGPFGKVGWVTFDGNGNFSGNDTVSFNGTMISREFSGNYTVESSCKISIGFTDNLGNSGSLEGVIVNQGKKILLIQVAPAGRVITSVAEKI